MQQNDSKEENKAREFGTQKKLSQNHSAEEWMLYLTAKRDNNSGNNVIERRGSMETKADGEVQSKDLAFAATASTNDFSNCCCIQRMTMSDVQKARTICNCRS